MVDRSLDSAGALLAPDFAQAIVDAGLRRGGDFAEVFAEYRRSLSLRLDDRKLESVVSGVDLGASVRVVSGPTTSFGYVESLEQAGLVALVERLTTAETHGSAAAPVLVVGSPRVVQRVAVDPSEVAAEQKAALLRLADETARAVSSEVRQVSVSYSENRQRVWVANSRGTYAADDRTRVLLAVSVTAQRDGVIQLGRETLAHHGGFELFTDRAVAEVARQAAEKAVTMLGAIPAPTGRMPVILANGFGGVLFHEACGHGLEADYVEKKTSIWQDKLGTRVAGPHVSAYDDGISEGFWGSAAFDDEGTRCGPTLVIAEGVLTAYLTDLARADRLGLAASGNGRRQDFRHLPYPRMTNTYFAPGELSPGEIIGDTKRALYAKSLSGGEVNPATGDFVFGVSEAYLVENGRVGAPVRGATLIGNGVDVLMAVDAVADDLEVKAGMCGKEGQAVPVGTGQPTLRLKSLTVGGTGG